VWVFCAGTGGVGAEEILRVFWRDGVEMVGNEQCNIRDWGVHGRLYIALADFLASLAVERGV
jgi:hypothetical protein